MSIWEEHGTNPYTSWQLAQAAFLIMDFGSYRRATYFNLDEQNNSIYITYPKQPLLQALKDSPPPNNDPSLFIGFILMALMESDTIPYFYTNAAKRNDEYPYFTTTSGFLGSIIYYINHYTKPTHPTSYPACLQTAHIFHNMLEQRIQPTHFAYTIPSTYGELAAQKQQNTLDLAQSLPYYTSLLLPYPTLPDHTPLTDLTISYFIARQENPWQTTLHNLVINALPDALLHITRLITLGSQLNQQELDYLTCQEAFRPTYTDDIVKPYHAQQIQQPVEVTRHELDTTERYVKYLTDQALQGKLPPPRIKGSLSLPESDAFAPLQLCQDIRIIITPRGIWCSLIHHLSSFTYTLIWWQPDGTIFSSDRSDLAPITRILLAGVWRDACILEHKAFSEHPTHSHQQYPQSKTYKRRKVIYLPRLDWSTPDEREKIKHQTSHLRARHAVRGHIRNLTDNPTYSPPDTIIQQALEDYHYDIDAPLPGIGQTYVRSHFRGVGELVETAPDIICKGLFTTIAFLKRQKIGINDPNPLDSNEPNHYQPIKLT